MEIMQNIKIRKQQTAMQFSHENAGIGQVDLRDQIFIDQFGDDPEIKILLEMASMVEKKSKENQKQTFLDYNIR